MQDYTLLQTDNHTSNPPLSFYRPDALPAAQPTASKHWRQLVSQVIQNILWIFLLYSQTLQQLIDVKSEIWENQ